MWQAHCRLCVLIEHVAEHEYGNVVCSEMRKYVIGDMRNLAALDPQSGLLQGLSLGTFCECFAVLEMSTWEGPLPWARLQVSNKIVPSLVIRCQGCELLKSFGTRRLRHRRHRRVRRMKSGEMNKPAPWLDFRRPKTKHPSGPRITAATPTRG